MDTREKYDRYVMTSFSAGLEPVVVASAEGARVVDADGRSYIDCYAGISVVNAGHGAADVRQAAKEQIDRLIHCSSYTYYAQPVADLAERLAEVTPGRLQKSFFGNSGAEGIETAMRLAKVYTGKHEFIALERSFHGRTLGTLSITGNMSRKTRGGAYASGVAFAPAPYTYRSLFGADPETVAERAAQALEETIRFHTSGNVAAFIAEPVMGEGGIIVPPQSYLPRVKEILDRYDILLIADEVQCGFGRTGKLFAIEHFGVEPDIMVMAKGIADGFPLSATIARAEIADSFKPGEHLSTFGGNPVSCAAGLANLEFMLREDLPGQAAQKGAHALQRLNALAERVPAIGEARGLGLMLGAELVTDREHKTPAAALAREVRRYCREHGVLVGVGGSEGNVVRIQPPLVISQADLDEALDVIGAGIESLSAAHAG
ncbi:MAG TPA: aspartate aminotransferase family protein [Ktedonobacterales bacterium]|nr:aspartate aminotransferase family protein [Ktedonobacterales bacterium]